MHDPTLVPMVKLAASVTEDVVLAFPYNFLHAGYPAEPKTYVARNKSISTWFIQSCANIATEKLGNILIWKSYHDIPLKIRASRATLYAQWSSPPKVAILHTTQSAVANLKSLGPPSQFALEISPARHTISLASTLIRFSPYDSDLIFI